MAVKKLYQDNTRGEFGDYQEYAEGFVYIGPANVPLDQRPAGAVYCDNGHYVPAQSENEVTDWLVWDSAFGYMRA